MSIQRALALSALTLATVSVARATTSYSSQGLLEASTPFLTFHTVDLTSYIGGGPYNTITDLITGITFSTPGDIMSVPNATTIHSGFGVITVTLPSTVVAFGAAINGGPGIGSFDFTGDSASTSDPFVTGTYHGFRVTAAPITSLTYTIGFGAIDLTGFEAASPAAAPTPEVGTLLSLGMGLLLIGGVKRRRPRPS